jgi:glucose-1-phosphate cytidylyltransferase
VKVVILAGGFGTRISEESHLLPKPMIEISGIPILVHIMRYYSSYGFNEFIILAGYKQNKIKEYFNNYYLQNSDVTFDLALQSKVHFHNSSSEPWRVTVLDTGINTMTGGRLLRAKRYLDETFLLTYGDGLSDIDLNELIKFHSNSNSTVTLSAVKPEGRFGVLNLDNNDFVTSFREKNIDDNSWINAGFMVVEPDIFDSIENDLSVFETDTLNKLVKINKLSAYRHSGFWQCMDTLRDKHMLERIYSSGTASWVK